MSEPADIQSIVDQAVEAGFGAYSRASMGREPLEDGLHAAARHAARAAARRCAEIAQEISALPVSDHSPSKHWQIRQSILLEFGIGEEER